MTLQLTPYLEQRFETLALATGRSANELVEDAISSYLDEVEVRTREMHAAEAQADREGWLTTDEVFARLKLRKTA